MHRTELANRLCDEMGFLDRRGSRQRSSCLMALRVLELPGTSSFQCHGRGRTAPSRVGWRAQCRLLEMCRPRRDRQQPDRGEEQWTAPSLHLHRDGGRTAAGRAACAMRGTGDPDRGPSPDGVGEPDRGKEDPVRARWHADCEAVAVRTRRIPASCRSRTGRRISSSSSTQGGRALNGPTGSYEQSSIARSQPSRRSSPAFEPPRRAATGAR